MKNIFLSFLLLSLLTACSQPPSAEELIVGKWKFSAAGKSASDDPNVTGDRGAIKKGVIELLGQGMTYEFSADNSYKMESTGLEKKSESGTYTITGMEEGIEFQRGPYLKETTPLVLLTADSLVIVDKGFEVIFLKEK